VTFRRAAGSQVENAVKSAFSGATAVHIKGTLTNSSGTLSLDLQLNKDNTAAARSARAARHSADRGERPSSMSISRRR